MVKLPDWKNARTGLSVGMGIELQTQRRSIGLPLASRVMQVQPVSSSRTMATQ